MRSVAIKTNKKLERLLLIYFLACLPSFCFAENPTAGDEQLSNLGKIYQTATTEYKTALKAKKDFIDTQIKEMEDALIAEDDKERRKEMVEHLREQGNQRNQLSDKLRVINAGEVVKLSNKTSHVVSFLTGQ